MLDYVHGGLRSTRGAAVSIARFDLGAKRSSSPASGTSPACSSQLPRPKRMVSMPGTAGFNARKIQAFDYPFERGLVILHSDGLATSWTLDRYPNLAAPTRR